ncbi:DUF1127 domain-containing protein [Faunimonas sp. B44]|uniref:DUF1127 domain-containing protein n=1 Tax=Faunimonas sp. B44 TaxID=3461493 RepID=UPI004043F273
MNVIANSAAGRLPALPRLLPALASVFGLVSRLVRAHRDRRLLQSMPDHMLADIGIRRSEIDHVVFHGRSAAESVRRSPHQPGA